MERDRETFAGLWKLGGVPERVKYHEGIPHLSNACDLVIFDEADLFLFNQYDQVAELCSKNPVLAFTASVSKSNFGSVEQELVKMLGFEASSYSVVKRDDEQEPDFDAQMGGIS